MRWLRQELEETSKAIEDATGERPFLFRPPFGGRRPGTFRVVEELKMFPVMWRVTCFDWAAKSHEEILKHARRQIGGGEVVLLHDGGQRAYGRRPQPHGEGHGRVDTRVQGQRISVYDGDGDDADARGSADAVWWADGEGVERGAWDVN